VKTVNGIRGLNFLPGGIARVDIADDTITVTLNLDNADTQTFTATLDGTETVPDGGIFRVIQIFDTGLPDGTPVAVDTPGLVFPIMEVGSSVEGGTITINYWSAYGSATMPAGTITVRPIL